MFCEVHGINEQADSECLLCAGANVLQEVAVVPGVRAVRKRAQGTEAGAQGGLPGGGMKPCKQEGRAESPCLCLGVGSSMPLHFY